MRFAFILAQWYSYDKADHKTTIHSNCIQWPPAYFPGDGDFCAASLLGFGGCTNLPKTYAVPVKSLVLNEQRAHEAVNLGPLRQAGARACCEWLRQICTTKIQVRKLHQKPKEPHMKRILSIQDISCIGKCSQTIALPVLSAMGIETSIIPTAVLSAHTMFPGFTFRDLTDDIPDIINHWLSLDINFDGILTGYLGSARQIDMISHIYEKFRQDNTIIILDPVFADKGRMYTGFDIDYANKLGSLCSKADYIVPNITEACYLARVPYKEEYDIDFIEKIMDILVDKGAKNVIVTSIQTNNKNGIVCRLQNEDSFSVFRDNIDAPFHGTGDLFASTFAGGLINGMTAYEAATLAVDYVNETLKATMEDNKHNWYGVNFETTIPYLTDRIRKKNEN